MKIRTYRIYKCTKYIHKSVPGQIAPGHHSHWLGRFHVTSTNQGDDEGASLSNISYNIIKHSNVKKKPKHYRAIAKTLNISLSTTGTIICRWTVNGTTSNHPWTGAL